MTVHSGAPPRPESNPIEVDIGVSVPVAFAGARRVLLALREVAPATVDRVASDHPAEWDRLFPGAGGNGPSISDLALSPSERRLHRESEQTFWILNLVAQVVVEVLQESGRALVVRQSGASDQVSLRGLMRAVEWNRIRTQPTEIVFGEWSARRAHASKLFEERHGQYMQALEARLRASPSGAPLAPALSPAAETPVDLEGRYLQATLDPHGSPEARIAAAVLAMRACFFTTNYEGAMLAAEVGLAQLDRAGAALDPGKVAEVWKQLDDPTFVTPAIEVDGDSLGDADELRALLHRQIGVVRVFTGENELGLAEFQRGLECKLTPERRGQLHMFRALTLIKRVGNLDRARAEIEQGLQGMSGRQGASTLLHEAWLRNVYALTHFQAKQLEPALAQEKLAMRCVGELHDPSATHLKINLISNISVLQETAKQFGDAIATWRRYEKISANWGANFFKHHAYRLGGLQRLAGETDSAIANYTKAYESARELGDTYHSQAIAAELGRIQLDLGAREKAAQWFEPALEAAHQIGDPRTVAESLAGRELARGGSNFDQAAAYAEQTSTYPKEAEKLVAAIRSGAGVQSALPAPRTKLNRSFDLVNLY